MKMLANLVVTAGLALSWVAIAQEDSENIWVEASATSDAAPVEADLFARDSYHIDSMVCPFKGDIDYEPGTIECGLLQVPENREKPDSRMIELHFVKLHSRWGREGFERDPDDEANQHAEGLADGRREDPVIYLTGGPGSPVTYYVNRFKDHTLLDHRDLYILEQRGIGSSASFCPFFSTRKPAARDVDNFDEYLASARTDRRDCALNATAAGVDLTGYNTIENARDVKALRRALGFEQWNVWGISYGSILGQAYIKEDPEGILAVALDAIMPLDIQGSEQHWRVIHWYERDLQKLQEICQAQPSCAATYPDIPGRLREAVQTMIDQPVTVSVKDTEYFPSGQARVFSDIAAMLPFIFLYEQVNYPALPGLVYAWADAIERRDASLFQLLASTADEGGLFSSSEGMRMAILCNDGDVEAQGNASNRDLDDYPILAGALMTRDSVARDTALCAETGMPMRAKADYSPTVTDIPTLIIEGDMDPITPPPNAKAILPGFSNGTYVEFPYAGHGPSRSVACAGHLLNKFFDHPGNEPDLSCVDDMEVPEMWTPMYPISIVARLAARFEEDPKTLALPLAWAAFAALGSLLAFTVFCLAPLGRWMDDRNADHTEGARLMAWLASATVVLSLGILAAALAVTASTSEMLVILGLVPWAKWGGYLALLGMLVGLASLWTTLKARGVRNMPLTRLLGYLATAVAALAWGGFVLTWGLGPF